MDTRKHTGSILSPARGRLCQTISRKADSPTVQQIILLMFDYSGRALASIAVRGAQPSSSTVILTSVEPAMLTAATMTEEA